MLARYPRFLQTLKHKYFSATISSTAVPWHFIILTCNPTPLSLIGRALSSSDGAHDGLTPNLSEDCAHHFLWHSVGRIRRCVRRRSGGCRGVGHTQYMLLREREDQPIGGLVSAAHALVQGRG
jgi:hypothetical protein